MVSCSPVLLNSIEVLAVFLEPEVFCAVAGAYLLVSLSELFVDIEIA